MSMTVTYSPEYNKLRLYSVSRLDPELSARVIEAGFIFAPQQELFVAPTWTPGCADLLLELCGEIDDEDSTLVERAEERSEWFTEYSEHRAEDADRAQKAVAAIAGGTPFGQPILIGHHSNAASAKTHSGSRPVCAAPSRCGIRRNEDLFKEYPTKALGLKKSSLLGEQVCRERTPLAANPPLSPDRGH